MATVQDVLVPDIGDFKDVPVIAVLVKPGDQVKPEDPLVTLESDKATMDVPAPSAGVVREIKVKVGDRVGQGAAVLTIEVSGAATAASQGPEAGKAGAAGNKAQDGKAVVAAPPAAEAGRVAGPDTPASPEAPIEATRGRANTPVEIADPTKAYSPAPAAGGGEGGGATATPQAVEVGVQQAHAGPGVRRMARELGVDLGRVKGSGPKGRILPEDVRTWVKAQLAGTATAPVTPGSPAGAAGSGLTVAPWPKVDFAKFGPVEAKPLTRLQKIAGPGLHRNWVSIPHVTNCEDADVTELEAFRVQLNQEQEKAGLKVTLLAFLVKACVAALQKFPNFNSSLDGEQLILKRYYNIGFAADTPQGLVVPVIKDADKKGVLAIAKETSELAAKARDGKLSPAEMQGATFTVSSLGGIGGTYFTPIINAPEVAILGVCRARMQPVWDGKAFVPRLMLPMSLSWDHRVVDGAAAARFNAHLASLLGDVRRLLL